MPTNPHATQDYLIDTAIAASPEYQRAQASNADAKFEVQLPDGGTIHVHRTKDGRLSIANKTALERTLMIAPTFIPGAQGVLSNIGGPAAQAATQASSGGSGAASGGTAAGGGGTAAGTGGTVATGTGGGGWGAFVRNMAKPENIISMGANVAGGIMASRASKAAAKTQSEAADKALALQREIFETGQRNQQPYLTLGSGAATRLNTLMGGGSMQPQGQSAAQATAGMQPLPPNQTGWTAIRAGSPIQPAPMPTQTVQMKAPDGSVKAVPASAVQHYQQLGAMVVQ